MASAHNGADVKRGWFWFSLRHNSMHEPINQNPPNQVQRLWMRLVFGMIEVRL